MEKNFWYFSPKMTPRPLALGWHQPFIILAWPVACCCPGSPHRGTEGLFFCRSQHGDEAGGTCCVPGDAGSAFHGSVHHSHHFCRWMSRFQSHRECLWDVLGCCICDRSMSMFPGKTKPTPAFVLSGRRMFQSSLSTESLSTPLGVGADVT